ncbi:MAG: hypothetical protein IKF78_05755 [Atopobiaceae bacterium]|nr:hypothetical protein [Atopobiaceae bacterium]
MLRRLGLCTVRAGDAQSGALFPFKLEFNPPAHGVWNIVHVGMLVPEAHQIYVCAINCMRGVVLTAAEMGLSERFSCVVLKEEDIIRGTVEEVTLTGIVDVLRKLEAHGGLPPCVMVFPVCTHHFLGVNMSRVYDELERQFPTVDFVRAFMDPIMKRRRSPDMWLRKVMFDPLPKVDASEDVVACLGSDFALDADCELRDVLSAANYGMAEIQQCATYEEYKQLAHAAAFISTYPNARYGIDKLASRLGRRHMYVPSTFSYDEIRGQYLRLHEVLGTPMPDFKSEIARCEGALESLRARLQDAPIAIDSAAHPRPLGLARLLLEHGLRVTEVYLDAANPEEECELAWLGKHAANVELCSIVLPQMRVASRERDEEVLAVGQKAAWFTGTSRFVNLVEGGGLWGFAGIRGIASLMEEAWSHKKDAHDLIPRKGLGCESCF